ncbi:DNA topoisomerase IV, alpha subunit [Byssothecium circinans]|uniref:DNA topoisomerase (ATP-hydrolyzing) n=1 Tax=Byssothecium circinans TaxID=147558 RepID=A0A6A5TZ50_9PLEO|nr:DNA topoisomerase IV, alpha subunit [Byssothecium circinans]
MDVDSDTEEMLFDLEETGEYYSDDMLFEGDETAFTSTPLPDTSNDVMVNLVAGIDAGGYGMELGSAVPDRSWIISRIEGMLETIIDGLLNPSQQLSISLKSRANLSRRQGEGSEEPSAIPPPKTSTVTFPGSNAQEAWRFIKSSQVPVSNQTDRLAAVFVRILELIHGSLIEDTIMTKRDMYYRHKDLFMKQSVVDRYVDDLACTFGVSRTLLNVAATAKGLIAGNFLLRRQDGSAVDGLSEKEGILLPKMDQEDSLDLASVRWVLVIEKEATFRSLLSSAQWASLRVQGLVLTAKGYPDLASRSFLRQIADENPHIPMLAFVDFDPDGIAIMSTYKHGSYRLAHEDVAQKDTPGLHLPELRWLGVQSHHLYRAPVCESSTQTAALADAQGLMRLTARDRRKAHQMLEWDLCAEGGLEPAWRAELQRMLMLNIKAEMQILDELPGGLVSWLGNELDVLQGSAWTSRSAVATIDSDDEILFA